MKRFPQNALKFDKSELKTDLGENNFIFVGSSTDMFENSVPDDWILYTLAYCNGFPKNRYLFQTKNPSRLLEFQHLIPPNSVIGTTLETNRDYPQMGLAPPVDFRASAMFFLKNAGFETMVTAEPIMDFDIEKFPWLIMLCNPSWVNIGADSQGHKLPEPSKEKVERLINELGKHTNVRVKENLKRIAAV